MILDRLKNTYQDWRREDAYVADLEANHDPLYVSDPKTLRLYILVRADILPPINQGIQAAHALAELMHAYPSRTEKWAVQHKTLILLGASEDQMTQCIHRAHNRKLEFATFQEPDLGDLWTATAFEPMIADKAKDMFFGLRAAR